MTTQLNLLPDVKLEYIKAQRSRQLVISASVLVTAAAIVLVLLLLSVDGLQKKHLSDLNNDIKNESSQLQGEPNISRILTIQNQLNSLTALHQGKPAASRLFAYLNEITPSSVDITDFNIDFTQKTATISGTSANLANVNKYVDTLKNTTYKDGDNSSSPLAFSNVVLSSFSLNTGSQDPNQAADYTINLAYDPTIFNITHNVNLIIPNLTPTRTQQSGSDLFQAAPPTTKGQQ